MANLAQIEWQLAALLEELRSLEPDDLGRVHDPIFSDIRVKMKGVGRFCGESPRLPTGVRTLMECKIDCNAGLMGFRLYNDVWHLELHGGLRSSRSEIKTIMAPIELEFLLNVMEQDDISTYLNLSEEKLQIVKQVKKIETDIEESEAAALEEQVEGWGAFA